MAGERVRELEKQETALKGILAKSDLPCIYCGLPASDMAECSHGFPGCSRGDDLALTMEADKGGT